MAVTKVDYVELEAKTIKLMKKKKIPLSVVNLHRLLHSARMIGEGISVKHIEVLVRIMFREGRLRRRSDGNMSQPKIYQLTQTDPRWGVSYEEWASAKTAKSAKSIQTIFDDYRNRSQMYQFDLLLRQVRGAA